MVEFRVLGSVELKDPRGRDIESILTQPKNLALLTYLAVARPRGFHRRDKLLGLFWPELNQGHARHALNQALYRLRTVLGEEIVVSRGQEEVGLSAKAVWVDAISFEEALAEGDFGAAMHLYRGELLVGFFLSGAPEFERWLHAERDWLIARAAQGAWDVADELRASGDPLAAARAARHAATFSPGDEGVLRRLVAFLDDLGDRGGAIQAYEAFASRLANEYEVDPSPESEQLIEAVRTRAAPSEESAGLRVEEQVVSRGPRAASETTLPSGEQIEGYPRRGIRWRALLIGALGVTSMVALWNGIRLPSDEIDVIGSVSIAVPEPAWLGPFLGQPLAISPDGRHLAFVSYPRGPQITKQLYLRPLSGTTAVPVAVDGEAEIPFFSPDSRWVGFFAAGRLMRVSVDGGLPTVLAEVGAPVHGATWGADDIILYSQRAGLFSVRPSGGPPTRLTAVDSTAGEGVHLFPHLLPDGRAALFNVADGADLRIALLDLESRQWRILEELGSGATPRYAPSGHVLFTRQSQLLAASFDIESRHVTGAPVVVQDSLLRKLVSHGEAWRMALFTSSEAGALAYVSGNSFPTNRLVMVDTAGTERPVRTSKTGYFTYPRFAPDGQRIAVTLRPTNEESRSTWVLHLESSSATRLNEDELDVYPVWNSDGMRITYAAMRTNGWGIYSKQADGAGEVSPIFEDQRVLRALSWSPDGRFLSLSVQPPVGGRDIWLYRTDDDVALPFLATQFHERSPMLSPRGRWLAYVSDMTGRDEVYVQHYPVAGKALMVSSGGGVEPVWSADGSKLFYRWGEQLLAVDVELGEGFSHGAPRVLLEGQYEFANQGRPNYDVAPDGRSFVMIRAVSPGMFPSPGEEYRQGTTLHLSLNWEERLTAADRSARAGG